MLLHTSVLFPVFFQNEKKKLVDILLVNYLGRIERNKIYICSANKLENTGAPKPELPALGLFTNLYVLSFRTTPTLAPFISTVEFLNYGGFQYVILRMGANFTN